MTERSFGQPMRVGYGLATGLPLWCVTERYSGPMPKADKGDDDLSLRGRRILVVEDEGLIALLLIDALEEAGATVIGPCYTLGECLKVVQSEEFDAAILDVDLAGRDVFPAADTLKQRSIPFVFHTAHGDRDELRGRFGDVKVCRKPVSTSELLSVVSAISRPEPSN